MDGVEIHSTSAINGDVSKDDQIQELKKSVRPSRPPLGLHKTSWTSYMIRENSEPSSLFSSSASGSSVSKDATSEVQPTADRKDLTTDTTMEDVSPATESATQILTTQSTEPVHATPPPASISNTETNNTAITNTASVPTPVPAATTPQTPNPTRRNSTRIHTRNTSISATMDLPWSIDTTSSPSRNYTSTHHKRNSSFGIPPPPRANEIIPASASRNNSSSSYSSDSSTADSPRLHPLMTRVATTANLATAPSPYAHSSTRQAPSPYTSTSISTTSSSISNNAPFNFDFQPLTPPQHQTYSQPENSYHSKPHAHSLTSPPGYTQNPHAHTNTHATSFSSFQPSQASRTTPATSISISTTFSPSRRSSQNSSYSPLDTSAPPLYTSNQSPLYQSTTNQTSNTSSYGYNSTLFSSSFSFSAPKTPTPKKHARAGILDNDPNMYLTRSQSSGAAGGDEDSSIWDTATKWMRSTSKKLSLGGENLGSREGSASTSAGGLGMGRSGDFNVSSGLWKMVGGGGNSASIGGGGGAGGDWRSGY